MDIPFYYAQKIAGLIKSIIPECNVEIVNSGILRVNGQIMPLDNLYKSYKLDEDEDILNSEHHNLQNYLRDIVHLDINILENLQNHIDNIYPRICTKKYIKNTGIEIVHNTLCKNIVVYYVIDMPSMMVSVDLQRSIKWGLSIEDLDSISKANLQRESSYFQPSFIRSEYGGTLCKMSFLDHYTSSRLVLPGLHDSLSGFLGDDFYAAAPSKDVLWCFSKYSDKMINEIKEQVNEKYIKNPYPITDKLFTISEEGISIN